MTHNETVRIGFVGGGGMIREHAKAFRHSGEVELVGITNRTHSKAQSIAEECGIAAVYDSINALIVEAKPDLVVMAVYEPAILEIAVELMQYDVALFMEKPVGIDLLAAETVAKVAAERNRRVWVGLNRRSLGSTLAVLNDIEHSVGPRHILVQDQQSLEVARAIGHSENVVDNWMYANSIHLVDYLLSLSRGTVAKVEVLSPWNASDPGVVLAHVTFSSGDVGIYQGIWNGPGPWACSVATPERRWDLRPLERAVFQNAGERTLTTVDVPRDDVDFKPGFARQAREVIKAVRGLTSEAPTIDDALASTRLVARIYGKAS